MIDTQCRRCKAIGNRQLIDGLCLSCARAECDYLLRQCKVGGVLDGDVLKVLRKACKVPVSPDR